MMSYKRQPGFLETPKYHTALKYKIPFVMVKCGLYRTVFLLLWLMQKSGYQITGKNSLFK